KVASSLMLHTTSGAYTPSADRLVTATQSVFVVRDATGSVRGSGFPSYAGSPSTSPDGCTILTLSGPGTACLLEILPGREPVPGRQVSLTARSRSTVSRGLYAFWADLRADGQKAVSLSRDAAGREQVRVADPATGRPLGVPASHHPGWVVQA